tara:strand:+ start:235 stop:402 length:168 start_codon:yes stop_codon:yes gene_type:complete
MIDPEQVATYEVVNIDSVYLWIANGQLKAKKLLNGKFKIKMDDYLEFAKKGFNER